MEYLDYARETLQNGLYILLTGLFPWIVIAFVFQKITKSMRDALSAAFGGKTFVYLTAPGVVLHELGHAFFCLIFRHKITEMKLFSPEKDGTLGYVSHRYDPTSLYQRAGNFFIGTGPVWIGIVMLAFVSYFLLPAEMTAGSHEFLNSLKTFFCGFFSAEFWCSWTSYLWIYLALTISAHITLSKEDLNGAQSGFTVILLLIFGACLLFGWCGKWEEILMAVQLDFLKQFLPMILTMVILLTSVLLVIKIIPHRKR